MAMMTRLDFYSRLIFLATWESWLESQKKKHFVDAILMYTRTTKNDERWKLNEIQNFAILPDGIASNDFVGNNVLGIFYSFFFLSSFGDSVCVCVCLFYVGCGDDADDDVGRQVTVYTPIPTA